MTSFEEVNKLVAELAVLKFFPNDVRTRLTIVRILRDMATSDDQVRWLIGRVLVLYNDWPGPRELRAIFCTRYQPRDGIEARSEKFPEGIPGEKRSDKK